MNPHDTSLLSALDVAFNQCASPNNTERRAGEEQLRLMKTDSNYPLLLLNYILSSKNLQKELRASIEIKLWTERLKQLDLYEVDQMKVSLDELKNRIVIVYLSANKKVADQLCLSIVNLSAVEFPDRWPTLLGLLTAKIVQNEAYAERVFELLAMITYKYSYLTRSDPLYREINIVCDAFHDTLLNSVNSVLVCIKSNHPKTQLFYDLLKILMRLFYNMNYQELHPKFEDNIAKWMGLLIQIMKLEGRSVKLLKTKSQTLKCMFMYANKYKDDINTEVIQSFTEQIWNLCSNVKGISDDDDIHQVALKYFKSLVTWPDMKSFFASHIENILTTLIFPTIGVNSEVVSMFEEEPQLFIEVYFQNSEVGTRRSTAIELLKSITRHYNFNDILKKYIGSFIESSKTQPENIPGECLLLNLVIESATVGYRSLDGVTQLGIQQQIIDYVYQNIVKVFFSKVYPELIKQKQPILIESKFNLVHVTLHLRFVYFFRLYVPPADLQLLVRFCSLMFSNSVAFKNITCMMLQALIGIQHGDYLYYTNMVPYFDEKKIEPLAVGVLTLIYKYQQKEPALNMQVTKTLQIICSKLKNLLVAFSQHVKVIIENMLGKTDTYDFKCVISLFQSVGLYVYYLLQNKQDIKALEVIFEAYFKRLLSQGSDLLNFMFQIYSLIVQLSEHPSPVHNTFYQSLLSPTNWCTTNTSLFSAYIQYIISYIKRHPDRLTADKTSLQCIFTKLIELKAYKHFYQMLSEVIGITGLDGFYSSGYLSILIHGTTAALSAGAETKTQVLKASLLLFCKIIIGYDPKRLIEYTNSVMANFLESLILESLSIVSMIQIRQQRRLVFQGITTLIGLNLVSSINNWTTMLNALIENTNRRFVGRSVNFAQTSITQNADSAYQKLSVFKLIPAPASNLVGNEEEFLVKSILNVRVVIERTHPLHQLLPQKSLEQLNRLMSKYTGP